MVLTFFLALALLLGSCSPKPSSPIDSIAEECAGDLDAIYRYTDLWGHPTSPARNDSLLLEFIDALLRQPGVDADVAEALRDMRADVGRNFPGTTLADLPLTLADGRPARLHDLLSPDDTTIVMVYDPDCEGCDAQIARLDPRAAVVAISVARPLPALPPAWVSASAVADTLHAHFYLPLLPAVYAVGPGAKVVFRY